MLDKERRQRLIGCWVLCNSENAEKLVAVHSGLSEFCCTPYINFEGPVGDTQFRCCNPIAEEWPLNLCFSIVEKLLWIL